MKMLLFFLIGIVNLKTEFSKYSFTFLKTSIGFFKHFHNNIQHKCLFPNIDTDEKNIIYC